MKIKTAEASNKQLDWGVAVVETQNGAYHECGWDEADGVWVQHFGENPVRFDHTDPAVCMGLIKEHRFPIFAYIQVGGDGCLWQVNYCDADVNAESWESLEQAVARCVISMRLGDEFECPSELGVML